MYLAIDNTVEQLELKKYKYIFHIVRTSQFLQGILHTILLKQILEEGSICMF